MIDPTSVGSKVSMTVRVYGPDGRLKQTEVVRDLELAPASTLGQPAARKPPILARLLTRKR